MKESVVCICIANADIDSVRRSVFCYQQQTHPVRRLIALTKAGGEVSAFLRSLSDNSITIREVSEEQPLTPSTIATDLQDADFLFRWDAGDWSHPSRIAMQLEFMRGSDADACYLQSVVLAFVDYMRYVTAPHGLWFGSLALRAGRGSELLESLGTDVAQLRRPPVGYEALFAPQLLTKVVRRHSPHRKEGQQTILEQIAQSNAAVLADWEISRTIAALIESLEGECH